MTAYDAVALPLGHPAVEQWHGVSVLPRACKVLETPLRTLAHAVHKIGAVSRNRTGIA